MLIFPGGTRYKYQVAAFKLLDHSIAELEQRKMAILLPFYVLKLRKQVRAAKTGKRRQELAAEMGPLLDELEKTADRSARDGVLDEEDIFSVITQIGRLNHELYWGYTEFRRIDKMRQEKILNPAEELKLKEQRKIARNLKAQDVTPEKIAAATGLPLKVVEKL